MTSPVRARRAGLGALLLLILAVLGGGLALAGPASAQELGDNDVVVRAVDGRNPDAVEVQFIYTGPRASVTDLVIRENGRIVATTPPVLLEESRSFGIVLAIDISGSMRDNNAFERSVEAAKQFIANKNPADQIAIVAFNDRAQVVQQFSADQETLVEAVERLGIGGGTAIFDGVRESVNLFEGTDLVPNIVLLTDGDDTHSATTLEAAQGLLDDANALLYGIGLESNEFDPDTLEALASVTGGSVLTAGGDDDIGALYAEIQSAIRRQFRTTFVSEADVPGGTVNIRLTVGTATTEASYTPGARLDSTLNVQPVEVPAPRGIEALQSPVFLWVALGLLLLAVAAAVYAVAATLLRERSTLDSVMQPYEDGFVAGDQFGDESNSMVTSSILQRAVDMTGDMAQRRGLLTKAEDALERANLPLRAAEAIFFYVAGVVVVALLAGLLTGNLMGTLIVVVLAVLIPPAAVSFIANRRRKQFEELLPDMLNLLASTLRAGYSLMQGMEAAAQEVSEPMKKELQRVVTESRLGMPVEQALENVAIRMDSKDFAWAVMAVNIQRQVGGNLAELLVTVADTMTERIRLKRDVNTLTAEGKVSAIVLGLLPLALGAMMFVLNPGYIGTLFEEFIGNIMLVAAGLLMGFGFWWMYKMIDIEV